MPAFGSGLVHQEKPEQAVEPVADTENVGFIVKPGDVADVDRAESALNGRIKAFSEEVLFKILSGFQGVLKYGRESQETLVSVIIEELSLHAGVRHNTFKGVKKRMVFQKPFLVHIVRDGGAGAPVKIAAFIQKADGIGIQQTDVGDQGVLSQFDRERNLKEIFFQERASKQFIPQLRGDAVVEEAAMIQHLRIDVRLQSFFIIETGCAKLLALDIF